MKCGFKDRPAFRDLANGLSDLVVRDTLQKKEFIENGGLDEAPIASLSAELGFDPISASVEGDLKLAEKIQMKAFTLGNEMGAQIAPTQGAFGKEISDTMGDFIKPMD